MGNKESTASLTSKEVTLLAIEAKGQIISEARQWMLDWLRKNPEWIAAHLEEVVGSWANEQLRRAVQDNNRALRGDQHGSMIDKTAITPFETALTEAINANYSRMMDASIWGGKKIGDATPDEIRDSARRFAENGSSMLRQHRWQSAIAEAAEKNGAGPNEPVRNVLSPTTFDQLWEQSDAV